MQPTTRLLESPSSIAWAVLAAAVAACGYGCHIAAGFSDLEPEQPPITTSSSTGGTTSDGGGGQGGAAGGLGGEAGSGGLGCGAAPSDVLLARSYGADGVQEARAAALDPSGNLVVAGVFDDTLNLDGHTLPDHVHRQAFAAKWSSDGSYLWSKVVASADSNLLDARVASDGAGNVYLAGTFVGDSIDMCDGTYVGVGSAMNIFLTRYDADGECGWAAVFGSDDFLGSVQSLSAHADGYLAMGG